VASQLGWAPAETGGPPLVGVTVAALATHTSNTHDQDHTCILNDVDPNIRLLVSPQFRAGVSYPVPVRATVVRADRHGRRTARTLNARNGDPGRLHEAAGDLACLSNIPRRRQTLERQLSVPTLCSGRRDGLARVRTHTTSSQRLAGSDQPKKGDFRPRLSRLGVAASVGVLRWSARCHSSAAAPGA
jgi:hypothetical protein